MGAGYGTRLKPLTDTTPKPLLDVGGRPLIFHILDSLISAGVEEFFINTHHLAHRYGDFFKGGLYAGKLVNLLHEEVLLDTVSAHLDAVKKESPVFYRQLERKMSGEKDHLAAQFLRTISPALINPPAAKPRRQRETQPFYSCRLAENRILYLAPGILTPQAKTELKNILRKTIPQKTPLIGIILDLRDASGSDPLDGWNLFSLFSFGSEKEAIQREPVPILVLTDARTREAAEVLAKLLEHTRYGLCIGERTQGAPFPRRTIQSGRHSFSVPLIPEKLENLTPDALTPAISTPGAPRMSFSD